MKRITIPEKFTQVDGRPFRTPKRDASGDIVVRKDKEGNPLKAGDGSVLIELEEADFLTLLRHFLNNIFALAQQERKKLTMEDSSLAYDVFRAIRVAENGVLELENAAYQWLLRKVDEFAVDVFGINAAVFKEVLGSAEDGPAYRAERRREKRRER